MTLTREESNKRRSDNYYATLFNRYNGLKSSIVHAFKRARKEHWTHKQLLDWRDKNVFPTVIYGYGKLPNWVKYKLEGVWDACQDILWMDLLICYPHPDTGVMTRYDDLKDAVDLSRLDGKRSAMCYPEGLHPF